MIFVDSPQFGPFNCTHLCEIAALMKAVAIRPGIPNSIHLTQLPRPNINDIQGGRGVLSQSAQGGRRCHRSRNQRSQVRQRTPGYDFLVLGHESFGIVEEVGPNVTHVKPGDYVTATVRRPGKSIYDLIGTNDMTSDEVYFERGINLLHGYLTEYYVDDAEYIVQMPTGLKHLHVLAEPMSCAG